MPTAPVEDSFERLRALEKKRFDTERMGRIPVMDAETLRELCLENEGYETPELNDSLYAHFRGFQKIEGWRHTTTSRRCGSSPTGSRASRASRLSCTCGVST